MTQEELDAIRARVDAATAIIAEWGEKARYVGETEDAIPLYVDRRLSRAERFALYHFQLHAYEDIPALLAAVDRLRARIVEFETQLQPKPAESAEWQYCPTCGFLRHTGRQ